MAETNVRILLFHFLIVSFCSRDWFTRLTNWCFGSRGCDGMASMSNIVMQLHIDACSYRGISAALSSGLHDLFRQAHLELRLSLWLWFWKALVSCWDQWPLCCRYIVYIPIHLRCLFQTLVQSQVLFILCMPVCQKVTKALVPLTLL
ncbi:hypothetical protein PVAP13_2KG192291 [Panicum virgatum]|uniref:Secreted protein n=1 Tax=Panicum virgatum TaxID=38727 RepID=A0A8T0WB52_PANVG|nr:hypothetical protein PVAP13_2KG192291 [Panicum virgatum]